MNKNAKIRVKVITAIGLIVLLMTAVITGLLITMNGLANMTQKMYRQPYAAADAMWTIRRDMVDIERVMNKLTGVKGNKLQQACEAANATLDKDAKEVQEKILLLENMFTSQDKIDALKQIKETISSGSAVRQQVMQLIQSGQADEAQTMLTEVYEPIFDTATEQILSLASVVTQDAENFVSNASASSRNAMIAGLLILAASLLFAFLIAVKFTESLVVPIRQIEAAAIEMSKGNLDAAALITYHSRDELGSLADSLRITMTNLSAYVNEISDILLRLAKGDLTVPRDKITDYLGDFAEIKTSFLTILKSFNSTLGEIHESASQVNGGSSQLSNASQLLSQGATEQASAIEELTANVEEISGQIRENADNAQNANHLTDQVYKEVEESNLHMTEMNTAMKEISGSSQEIGKIIKTIEDIAFQTNILALNAAVEAARAGAAGKGFAVVADEVRNLASKSAEASKSTASLIENSVRAVENGSAIAEATAKSLGTVAQSTRQVVDMVDRIAKASAKQAASVESMTTRVEQISNVVQTNSATAEESAAASEELSGQADVLNHLVERFSLFQDPKLAANSLPQQVEARDMALPAAPSLLANY